MEIEKLFTKEITIKVSIIKLDNKKMTKGIFNQLHIISPLDKLYNLKENTKILGYINEKGRWIIWSNNENIYKYELNKFFPLRRIDLNAENIEALISVYPSEKVKNLYHADYKENYREMQISSVLDIKEQYEIIEKKEMIEKLIEEILKRQIYI